MKTDSPSDVLPARAPWWEKSVQCGHGCTRRIIITRTAEAVWQVWRSPFHFFPLGSAIPHLTILTDLLLLKERPLHRDPKPEQGSVAIRTLDCICM